MTKRSPVAVVVLTLVTFTLYAYYWLYATTDELRNETDRDDLNPFADVLLAVVTFGLWGVYAACRNARIVHEEMLDRGAPHTDRTLGVAAFAGLTFFTGWAWLVSMALLQEDLNRLADTEFDVFTDARPIRARVEIETERAADSAAPTEPWHAAPPAKSRWEDAPAAPVFTSNAPMPIVY